MKPSLTNARIGEMIGTARITGIVAAKLPPTFGQLANTQQAEKPAKQPRGTRKQSAGERAYEEFLIMAEAAGLVQFWKAEPWKLRLAEKTIYTPDFFVVLADGTPCLCEIKGFWSWDDAKVKYKVAREMFPQYAWIALEYKSRAWRVLFKNGREPLELFP